MIEKKRYHDYLKAIVQLGGKDVPTPKIVKLVGVTDLGSPQVHLRDLKNRRLLLKSTKTFYDYEKKAPRKVNYWTIRPKAKEKIMKMLREAFGEEQ